MNSRTKIESFDPFFLSRPQAGKKVTGESFGYKESAFFAFKHEFLMGDIFFTLALFFSIVPLSSRYFTWAEGEGSLWVNVGWALVTIWGVFCIATRVVWRKIVNRRVREGRTRSGVYVFGNGLLIRNGWRTSYLPREKILSIEKDIFTNGDADYDAVAIGYAPENNGKKKIFWIQREFYGVDHADLARYLLNWKQGRKNTEAGFVGNLSGS